MFVWYAQLSSLEQAFALVAIGATTMLLLQTMLQLIGFGSSLLGDSDATTTEGLSESDVDTPSDLGDAPEAPEADFDAAASLAGDSADSYDEVTTVDESADYDGQSSDGSGQRGARVQGVTPALRVFTIRGIVAFFALAGWTGLIALQNNWGLPMVFGMATLAGLVGAYVIAKIMQTILKVQYSGTLDLENAIGLEGEVYIRIPAKATAVGKVNLLLQGRYMELDAITLAESDLLSGSKVQVVDIRGADTLVVKAARD